MDRIDDSGEQTAAHPIEAAPPGPPGVAGSPAAEVVLEAGDHLVFDDGESLRLYAIVGEWTHIGRSAASEIRFEDPTVSRRHALLVRRPDGLKIVDDRSLNGVSVNGERVEIRVLSHGDTIQVGRHALHFVSIAERTPLAQALPALALQV